MSAQNLNVSPEPLPTNDPMVFVPQQGARVDSPFGRVTRRWQDYLTRLLERISKCAIVVGSDFYTETTGVLVATSFRGHEAIAPNVYRVTVRAAVVQIATTSSSLQLSISWVENGTTRQANGILLNANLLDQHDTLVAMVRPDAGTLLTFAASYASVGATPMQYNLDARLERLPE